jgi:hypothetical protein
MLRRTDLKEICFAPTRKLKAELKRKDKKIKSMNKLTKQQR